MKSPQVNSVEMALFHGGFLLQKTSPPVHKDKSCDNMKLDTFFL
jgi:hypothetical protein